LTLGGRGLDVLDDWFTHPDDKGRLFVSACAEFPSKTDPVQRLAAQHYASAEVAIRQLAEAAGAREPDALAREWAILLQGALTYRLVACDDDAAAATRRVAEVLLNEQTAGGEAS